MKNLAKNHVLEQNTGIQTAAQPNNVEYGSNPHRSRPSQKKKTRKWLPADVAWGGHARCLISAWSLQRNCACHPVISAHATLVSSPLLAIAAISEQIASDNDHFGLF